MRRLFHPLVRDLAWVLESPGLLDPEHAPWKGTVVPDSHTAPWVAAADEALQALDRDPRPLAGFIAHHHQTGRLGNYFEILVEYWLRELHGCPRVEAGVPIRRGQETLGELDFVFTDVNGAPRHWEIAVKFYMGIADGRAGPSPSTMDRFFGQALKDRLDLKVNHSIDRQLTLSSSPEARARVKELGIEPGHAELVMKGRLFYRHDLDWRAIEGPTEVSIRHLRGWWKPFDPLSPIAGSDPAHRWVVLPKHRWLSSPCIAEGSVACRDLLGAVAATGHLAAHFAETGNAIQMAEMRLQDGVWDEVSRGMILKPGWPIA